MPPVGTLPVNGAAAFTLHIVWAEEIVFPPINGLTVIITGFEYVVHTPEITLLRYQRLVVRATDGVKSCPVPEAEP
jgi:hypothetical protein